ncbi:hypothetical protein NKG05_06410 [Oerskovia sp. M15]
MRAETPSRPRSRGALVNRRAPLALALVGALALGGLGLATTAVPGLVGLPRSQAVAADAVASNLALVATPGASFTASHNSLFTINDGAGLNAGGAEDAYWGTWTATERPATQWIEYTWTQPVIVDRSVIRFWTDVAAGTGANVASPQSWAVQYWDDAAGAWADVAAPSGYGTARTGTNETTFTAATTTKVRATFRTAPNAAARPTRPSPCPSGRCTASPRRSSRTPTHLSRSTTLTSAPRLGLSRCCPRPSASRRSTAPGQPCPRPGTRSPRRTSRRAAATWWSPGPSTARPTPPRRRSGSATT